MEEEPADSTVEARKELMISLSGDGNPVLRTAHFLKPTLSSTGEPTPKHPKNSPFSLPSTFEPKNWPLKLSFHGWRCPTNKWKEWVAKMAASHESTWHKAGIYQAVLSSTYDIPRDIDLVIGFGQKWNPQTNTFIFPWGEATITLEDMFVSGYSVLGSPVLSPLETDELQAIEGDLKEMKKEFYKSKAKKASHHIWMKHFMENKTDLEHEAFLSLWLSRFVFPSHPHNTISNKVFIMAIHLARGTKLALAQPLLASIYRDLNLLKRKFLDLSKFNTYNSHYHHSDMLELTIWSPFQLVQVWFWERFSMLQPIPNSVGSGSPRLAKWHNVKNPKVKNTKMALNHTTGCFKWRPYAMAEENYGLDEEVESLALCLRPCKLVGIGCMEQYYPHRVAMQFGMDQDIPGSVTRSCNVEAVSVAWRSYSKSGKDANSCLPPRCDKPSVTTRYLEWWKESKSDGEVESGSPTIGLKDFQMNSKEGNSFSDDSTHTKSPLYLTILSGSSSEDSDSSTMKEVPEPNVIVTRSFVHQTTPFKAGNSYEDIDYSNIVEVLESNSNVAVVDPPVKVEQETIQSGPMIRETIAIEDTSKSEEDRLVHDADTSDHEIGSGSGTGKHGILQLETRIRKLQRKVAELKSARFRKH